MIVIVRHGQTEWNKVRRLQGWKNSPLTKLGKQQAANVANRISQIIGDMPFTMVSSPLGRALDTANIISSLLNQNVEIEVDPLLKEFSYGEWAGFTSDEIRTLRKSEWVSRKSDKWNYLIPGGESYSVVSERAKAWLSGLQADRRVVAVTHQMIGRTIRGAYLGLDNENTMALTQKNHEIVVLKDGNEVIIPA